MAISEIITSAREVLADESSDRWSDSRLIKLLNYGIRDLVVNSNLLTSTIYIEVDPSISTYDLSDKLLRIDRVEYDGVGLPLVSHSQMDRDNPTWQSETGDKIEAIVYDKLNIGMFRAYPSVSGTNTVANSSYGIIIDIDISHKPIYTDLESLSVTADYMSVYGITRPETLTALTDSRILSEQYDSILVHYIVGHALRSDMDEGNRAFGNEELSLYEKARAEVARRRTVNNAVGDLTANYRRL